MASFRDSDTWVLPALAAKRTSPFSGLVEVIDKTAKLEDRTDALDESAKQIRDDVDVLIASNQNVEALRLAVVELQATAEKLDRAVIKQVSQLDGLKDRVGKLEKKPPRRNG